jgi:hypothetical protein
MGSVKVTFRPNRRGVTAAGSSERVYRELGKRLDRVQQEALAIYEPHRKTGDYGRGFRRERTRIGGMAALRLVNVDPKAMILEKGTPPHMIEPKNAKALHWPGARHPVARVNHPGTKGLHIMRRALRAAGR